MNYNYMDRYNRLIETMKVNQEFLKKVADKNKPDQKYFDMIKKEELEEEFEENYSHLTSAVFYYIIRDWAAANQQERDDHYKMIVDEFKLRLNEKDKKYKVLVPGASLCRLVYEIAKLGNDVEANDYSFFNCLITEYVFNNCKNIVNNFVLIF